MKATILWIFLLFCCSVNVNAAYTDCEQPPTILHGKTELVVAEDGSRVSAIYTCESGFQLVGATELDCDLDTDEWKGELPACKQGGTEESPVAEIEQPEPTQTAPEKTHEEVSEAIVEVVPEESQPNVVEEAVAELPAPVEINESIEVTTLQPKRGRKNKNVEEDNSIDEEFSKQLDLTCGGKAAIAAPEIENAYISKYNRRRKGDNVFLVAVYECIEKFALALPDSNRLYCSNQQWIGSKPECVRVAAEGDEDEDDYDFDDVEGSDSESNQGVNNGNGNVIEQEIVNRVSQSESESVTSNECATDNGGCEHKCNVGQDESTGERFIECSCNEGYALDIDNKHCEKIPTPDASTGDAVLSISTESTILKTCGDGYRKNEIGDCVDIDECEEEDTKCQYCQNTNGSYECTCPDGYQLGADSKTCIDIDECTTYSEFDYDETKPIPKPICSHECQNTVGSYVCLCPPNYHLQSNKQICERDLCQHLGDISASKSKCSHECVDELDGFHCKCPEGMGLEEDLKTCVPLDSAGSASSSGNVVTDAPGSANNLGNVVTDVPVDKCAQNPGICGNLYCVSETNDYKCICPEGKRLSADGLNCEVTDLCQNDNGGCSDICNDVSNSVVCDCAEGSKLAQDGRTCLSASICEQNNGGCAQICNVEKNKCDCFPGYETNDDGKTCVDINECSQNNGGCSQECKNIDGGHECLCFPGFQKLEGSDECVDVDECAVNNGNCDHECTNTDGSYFCSCRSGFHSGGDQHQCVDINECQTNNGNCSHTCINSVGSYQCACPQGQFLISDLQCDYKNECETDNGGCSHGCSFKNGVITCSCPKGYALENATEKVCVDIDECLDNNGGCSTRCINLPGRHECECNAGFQLASDHGKCIDLDECIEDNGNCSNICVNTIGSYICACETGYELDIDGRICLDINECERGIHDCSHNCINIPGSYGCKCPEGFNLSRDQLNCNDIDECTTANPCTVSTDCVNTLGSAYCKCPDGNEPNGNGDCLTVNECDNPLSGKRCSHECEHIEGGFKCLCPNGLKISEDALTCIDINECETHEANCSHICQNTDGSYKCVCPDGYRLDIDGINCIDINECEIDNGQCDQRCVNFNGGVKCECDEGWTLSEDEKKCLNAEPCKIKNGGCDHVCEPLNGQPQCFCYKGFELNLSDNSSCNDINECMLSEHGCQSKCVNTVGSYRCDCEKGYRLNEINGGCDDIDECAINNGGCSPKSVCINFSGSFRCTCPTGFKLARDRVTCVEIKDSCAPISPPEHGKVHCSRSRHRSQAFYKVKCSVWCDEGYTLHGPSVKECNGNGGSWDETESICVPQAVAPEPPIISEPEIEQPRASIPQQPQVSIPQQHRPSIPQQPPTFEPELNSPQNPVRIPAAPVANQSPPPNCLPLPVPIVGTVSPPHCVSARSSPGQVCVVHCPRGYSPGGPSHATCGTNQQWSANVLHCALTISGIHENAIPKERSSSLAISGKKQANAGEIHNQGGLIIDPFPSGSIRVPYLAVRPILRPIIKCPQNTTILLPTGKTTVLVKLTQPQTNVNWRTQVTAHPAWAKDLQAFLTAGTHLVTFTARSPHSAQLNSVCRTVITVKSTITLQKPEVLNCPSGIEVQLRAGEKYRIINWREPTFKSAIGIKQFLKPQLPSHAFAPGVHKISYIATDVKNIQSTCEFIITVRAAQSQRIVNNNNNVNNAVRPGGTVFRGVPNHDSYLLCPGKPAMKLDTSFPVQIPNGCFVKNVRRSTNRLRRTFPPNSNILKLYSSWNSPAHRFYW